MRSIALYHIGKTGGTSVMQWLSSVRDEHQRSVFVYRYYQTSCFFTLAHHADIFYSTRDNNGTLVVPTRGDCQHHKIFGGATVFVEFHHYTLDWFWTRLRPQEAKLRQRHLERGGKYLSLVLLREPAQHIVRLAQTTLSRTRHTSATW